MPGSGAEERRGDGQGAVRRAGQELIKTHVVNETATRAWKGQVGIPSCAAGLDKGTFGSVTVMPSMRFVVVSILKEKYYISTKVYFHKYST